MKTYQFLDGMHFNKNKERSGFTAGPSLCIDKNKYIN